MFFTVSAPMPIQSISCDVRIKLYLVCMSDHSERFLKVLLLPITKIILQNDQLQKQIVHKSNERDVVSEFAILAEKLSKIAVQKKVDFLGLCEPSCCE